MMWFHVSDTLNMFDTFNRKKNKFFYNATPSARRKRESVGKPSSKTKIQEQRQQFERKCYASNLITYIDELCTVFKNK